MNELFTSFASFSAVLGFGAVLKDGAMLLVLCLLRVYAIFLVLPATADQALQGNVRNGVCICLALFIAWGQPTSLVQDMDMMRLAATLAKEAVIGLLLGFAASTVFWVAEGVGVLIDNMAGYNNVQQTNPLSNEQSTPVGSLLSQLAITGFYLLGGMMVLTGLLFDSFHWWPIHSLSPAWSTILEDFVKVQTGSYLEMMVKVAAPAMLVLVLIDLGFGILSKSAEKLEPNNLTQPVKGAVAIAMLSLLVAVFFEQVRPALSLHNLSNDMRGWSRTSAAQPVDRGASEDKTGTAASSASAASGPTSAPAMSEGLVPELVNDGASTTPPQRP